MRLRIEAAGPLTTVQDRGRVGLAHLGVPRAGPLDGPAAGLANRLVGNLAGVALLETTWGGLTASLDGEGSGAWVAVTGAPADVDVDGAARGTGRAEWLPVGGRLRIGTPGAGGRSYLAVAGGIGVGPVLGSRATDTLAWVGPPRVTDGVVLPLGAPLGPLVALDVPPRATTGPLRLLPGPRADWFADDALARLAASSYVVGEHSNRVGLRLEGPPVERVRTGELPSEGMVLGAVQVPPDGRPVVFLADHPPTGGYPVVALVHPADLWRCAQVRAGERIGFSLRSA